jgi:molybdopterin molybdotransferase
VALAEPVVIPPKLAYLLPETLSRGPRAVLIANPARVNTSGDFAGLIDSDGFIELPADKSEFPAGTIVPFTPWG